MATRWQRWTAVGLVAAGVMLGACGGDDDDSDAGGSGDSTTTSAPAAGSTIEVEGKEFGFDPDTITLQAGEPATIVLKNIGTIEHDITVSDADFKLTVAAAQSGEKTLTIDEPGTYDFHCSVAGHEAAGMKGEIIVE